MQFIWCLLIGFAVSGCMKIQDKDHQEGRDQVPVQKLSKGAQPVYMKMEQNSVRLEIKPSVEPGEYLLVFKWAGDLAEMYVEDAHRQTTFIPKGARAVSFRMGHSQNFLYRFYRSQKGEPIHWASFQGQTPKDLIIRTPISLSKDHLIKVSRLYILEQGSIQTNGFNLHIQVEDFIWQSQGLMKTFEQNKKASVDQEGRSGGLVYISAQRAQGLLNIEMRGEQGGDGSLVFGHKDRAPQGHPGHPGMIRGKGDFRYCTQGGRSNGNGQDGKAGLDGKNGRRGGHSGYLAINIVEESTFKVNFSVEAGRAGVPSKGTAGQKGGLAGKPYHNARLSSECGAPKMVGQDGKDGAPGKDGFQEPEGQKIPPCINIGNRRPECLS